MRQTAFIDEIVVTVVGGNGGSGIISFLREKARPNGGPNGGDGGCGGSVYAIGVDTMNTLSEYRFRRRIFAENGERGMGKNKHGKNGSDTFVPVPLGTRIFDAYTGQLHADIIEKKQMVMLSAGGRGGRGNAHFKTSINRAPRRATSGEQTTERQFRLQLTLLADIGLFGAPNAGKSTFLRAISAAQPKIASYPFTTLSPQLGVVAFDDSPHSVVVADIPGLINGASEGLGLGCQFLRHLSRTTFLCHILDITSPTIENDCITIEQELLKSPFPELAKKPRWLILNKIDCTDNNQINDIRQTMALKFSEFKNVLTVSAKTGAGVKNAMQQIMKAVCEKK